MKTQDYLSELRSRYSISSAYAVAKLLGVSQPSVGRYDKGISTFDDDVARRVAVLLDKHPALVVLDMHMERAQNEETRSLWKEISAGFPAPLRIAKLGLYPRV